MHYRAVKKRAAALLLVLLAVLRAAVTTRDDGFTIDEPFHIAAGVGYWDGDYRLNPEHPPLVKLWAGAFARGVLRLPPLPALSDKPAERAFLEQAVYGCERFEELRTRVRAAMLLLNALLLLAFAAAVRRAAGWTAALAALAFLAVDPTIAAHLPVVMTDLPVALLASTAVLLAGSAFGSLRMPALALSALALGGALGAKHSGLVAAAAVALVGAVAVARGQARARRAACVAAVFAAALLFLWSLYGFRYREADLEGDAFNRPLATKVADVRSPLVRGGLRAAEGGRLLPRAYLWGLADVTRASLEGRGYAITFFGRPYTETPPLFFPGALLVKVPLGLLALSLLGALGWRRSGLPAAPLRQTALLAGLLLAALVSSGSGYAGVRHALPLYPFLALLAGATCAGDRPRWWTGTVVAAALAALASTFTAARPWEYFNELAGGARGAHRLFNDEGVDLGQRSRELIRLYDERLRPAGELPFVDYPLSSAEAVRKQIRTRPWLGPAAQPDLVSGTFLLSAARLSPSPWYDYAPFREATPETRLGNLLLFRGTFRLPWLPARRLYAQALQLLYGRRDPTSAEPLLRRAAELYPQAYTAALELGNVLLARGDGPGAAEAYQRAARHAPPGSAVARALASQAELATRGIGASPLRNPWIE